MKALILTCGRRLAHGLFLGGFWVQVIYAVNPSVTAGGYAGTLGAGAATALERLALGQNPAALGATQGIIPKQGLGLARLGFNLDYHHPFGLQDLTVAEAGVYGDFRRLGMGFSWKETGVEGLFHEQSFAINPAIRFGHPSKRILGQLDLGGSWSLTSSAIDQEETQLEFQQSYGMVWRCLPRLKMGAFMSGIPSFGAELWPQIERIQWGLTVYNQDPDLATLKGTVQTLALDFQKSAAGEWKTLAAWNCRPHSAWQISIGFSSPPFQFSMGLQLNWQGIKWHQSLRYHRHLGRTHFSGLAYEWKRQ